MNEFLKTNPSFIDPKTLTLTHQQTFGVFDRWGDIFNFGHRLQGLFHRGTRYISKSELRIYDRRPSFLSSHIREENEIIVVDLVNPPGSGLSSSSIHILRKKFIFDEVLYESITLKNYESKKIEIRLTLDIASDFKDIFETRGFKRKSKQGPIEIICAKDTIEIKYDSLDNYLRILKAVSIHPCETHEGDFLFNLSLDPFESRELKIHFFFIQREKKENRCTHTKKADHNLALSNLEKEISEMKSKIGFLFSSNEQFNHWFNRSRIDLISLTAKYSTGYYPNAGVPWYNTVFGRDGLITAFQTLSFAPFLAKGVLLYLAKNQAEHSQSAQEAEPGKILHEVREGELSNIGELPFKKYYGTVDATPLFVWLAGLYFKRTNDMETTKKLWPHVKKALHWIDYFGDIDGDGFIEYKQKGPSGLSNQGWKDSDDSISHSDGSLMEPPIALCEVQGYVYQAKLQAAYLAAHLGEKPLENQLLQEAKILKDRFQKTFWDSSQKILALALDRNKKASWVLSSNAGHCLACEILDREQAEQLCEKLFSENLFSGWGIRTLAQNESRYNPMSYHNGSIWPHDNSMIAYGLARYRQNSKLLCLTNALFDVTLFLENQRMPELFCGFPRRKGEGPTYYPVACSPQAWAVGSVFILIESLLGLQIQTQRKKIIFDHPVLPGFLDELTLQKIPLSESETFQCRAIRYGNDVGFDVISIPPDWEIIVKK